MWHNQSHLICDVIKQSESKVGQIQFPFYVRGSFKKFYLLDHIFALENGTHLKFSTIIPSTFGYIV